jgi:pullulanase
MAVIHNANWDAITITLPHEGNWSVLVDGQRSGLEEIDRITGSQITVAPLSSFVLKANTNH